MGWISRKTEKGSYIARYRDPAGREHSKSFRTRAEAKAFLNSVENAKQRGERTDPAGAKVKFGDYAEQYLAGITHVRPGMKQKIEGHLNNQILPIFGGMPLGAIRPTDVRAWVRQLRDDGLASSTVVGVYRTFSKVLKTAVIDGLISRSPCIRIDLPKQTSHEEMRFLEPAQIEALADAIEPRFRALIFTAAYTGMRWGELTALRVSRLNLLKGTVDVSESLAEINGHLHAQRPKTGKPRTLSLPRSLSEMLGEHIGRYPSESGFVFSSPEGKPLRRNFYKRHLPAGACEVGAGSRPVPLHGHELQAASSSALPISRLATYVRGAPDCTGSAPEGDSGAAWSLHDHAHVRPVRTPVPEPRRAPSRGSRQDDPYGSLHLETR